MKGVRDRKRMYVSAKRVKPKGQEAGPNGELRWAEDCCAARKQAARSAVCR